MAWLDQIHHPKAYIRTFFKWGLLGLLMGAIGGLLGAGFHHALHGVTHLRSEHNWLIFLLPAGGLLSVAVYRLLRLRSNRGTNEIIDAVLDGQDLKPQIAPGIFLATSITHLFGGSAGREGAALQLGGSTASMLSKLFRLKREDRKILIMSGMSAVFAGLFGTPLTATLFCMEFESVGTIFSPALLPCYLAAFTAAKVSGALGVHAETAVIPAAILTWSNVWKIVLLAVLLALLGIAMCMLFHKAEHLAHHFLKNPWLRIAVGGALVLGLTLLVGDQRYNGAGMDMALGAVAGNADWYDFALKMLFTAITLAAGFKGGEIVPTFCVGATFGCVIGGLLGLEPGVAAALGLVGLFCCATNSPFASIVLSVEMFGSQNLHLFALVCVICFVLSGHSGLYSSQIIQFQKASEILEAREPEA
ncbi:MAG: chloride channel protein [Oscillospiraceae bacterium]|nr:chloride channel protein [Oscillospiraceae bacterium]